MINLRLDDRSVYLEGLYRGSPVFLVCNGPSFLPDDRLALDVPTISTMTLNNGGHGFRSNFWICVDEPSRFMDSIWDDPTIQKFVPLNFFEESFSRNGEADRPRRTVRACPNTFGYERVDGFSARSFLASDSFFWGHNPCEGGAHSVMLPAIKMLYYLGFRTIYLVGCDFGMSPDRRYWFDEDRTEKAIIGNNHIYNTLTGYFSELQDVFLASGLKVYNTTVGSNLTVFPHKRLVDAIASAAIDVSGSTKGMYASQAATNRS